MSSKSQRIIYSGFLSLSLLLKENQIKTARSDMPRESKETGRVNSLSHKMCVSIQQYFLILIQQHFGFEITFKAAFVVLGLYMLVSGRLKLWFCYQFSLQSTLESSIFLSTRCILVQIISQFFRFIVSWKILPKLFSQPSKFHVIKSPVQIPIYHRPLNGIELSFK